MSVEAVLARGRAHAERLMTDTCTVKRQSGASVAGVDLTPAFDTVYDGPCRVKAVAAQDRMVDTAGADVGVAQYVVSLPITATGVEPGDRLTITASTYDADQVGRVLTVLGTVHGSQTTARRLGCQEARP